MKYSLSFIIALVFLWNGVLLSQEPDLESILRFETGKDGKTLDGWGGGPPETIYFDSMTVHSGSGAARLERDETSPRQFSTITKKLPIDFGGRSVVLRGFLRTESVSGFAGLWMREDGPGGPVQFDNMQDRGLKGTTDWTEYIIRLPLDKEARSLFFGVLVAGEGKVWADDLQLLVDDKPISQAPKRVIKPMAWEEDQEFATGSRITVSSLTETQVEHIALLGKVWGFLKYHHPRVAAGELQWDFELFRVLPEVLNSPDRDRFRKALTQWINKLGVPDRCDPCAKPPENTHLLPEVGWIRDTDLLGPTLSGQLQDIHTYRFSGAEQFYVSQVPNVRNPTFEHELLYPGQQPPDTGYRILALFRLWNIIEYWFPYRDQLDDDWDSVLREFLPRFVQAAGWDKYRLELLAFIARIHDTHANLWSALDIRPPTGNCYLPFELRFVEGKAVVTAFTDRGQEVSGIRIGDLVEAIDGRPIESLIEEWSPFYCASNPTTRQRDIARFLPRGHCGESTLEISRDGQSRTVMVPREQATNRRPGFHDRPGEAFQLLSPEVAYLKLSSIGIADAAGYLERASGTRGLVIDIRNYPGEFVVFALGRYLVQTPTPFARFTAGDLDNPGAFTWTEPIELQPAAPAYDGKVAILVDEVSVSQGEYTAMALRAGPQAVVVGSTTAGADGDVSQILLPGGLRTMISGIGVFYPDKTPTQRVGIVPDIFVTPTIEGIRAGRDEVLEAALRHILGTDADNKMIREIAAFPRH